MLINALFVASLMTGFPVPFLCKKERPYFLLTFLKIITLCDYLN